MLVVVLFLENPDSQSEWRNKIIPGQSGWLDLSVSLSGIYFAGVYREGVDLEIRGFSRHTDYCGLASDHKYLRICDLCKELVIVVPTRILHRSGSGKPRPTLVWCLCAR